RWTEGRNLEAVLDLMARGSLKVSDLVTHRFGLDEAPSAYELLERGTEPCVAVQLTYPDVPRPDKPIVFRGRTPVSDGEPGIGLIGAGAFASEVLVPAL